MFVLLGIHVLRFSKLFLGALERGLDGVLVDLFLVDRVLGEDADAVTVDLGETATDDEELGGRSFGDAEFAVLASG